MEGDSTVRNADHGASGLTVRRKRGRPRKSDTVLLPGEIKALGIMPDSEAKFKKQRPAEADGLHVPQGSTSLIGQTVHGVIDGSFDAGFLVTVRLENEDSIYRGVIFGPGLSLPLSKITDIAPNVKVANRDETLSVFHPENTSAPLSETYALEPLTKPTPSETGIIPENVSRDQQHQDMVETPRHGIE